MRTQFEEIPPRLEGGRFEGISEARFAYNRTNGDHDGDSSQCLSLVTNPLGRSESNPVQIKNPPPISVPNTDMLRLYPVIFPISMMGTELKLIPESRTRRLSNPSPLYYLISPI